MNAPRTRVQRRPVHGVLLLDKPLGLSSNAALQRAKWLLRAEKAGHTGTLDPLATGVLPLCFGAATKFSQLQLEADKTYEATIRLGVKTSTADAEGEVIETRDIPHITSEHLAVVAAKFTGPIRQVPPMHSALKKDGKALYEYARAGEEVEREARDVVIYECTLRFADDSASSLLLRAKVSKGTYIRTLGEEIGEALGCGGHLTSLRRTATGNFDVTQCLTLEAFEALGEEQRFAALRPVNALLPDHTPVTLDADNAGRFLSGLRRRGDWQDNEHVAVYGEPPSQPSPTGGRSKSPLLGTAHIKGGELIPGRLLSPPEVAQILESIT
ncbi:MAG: tRNA pseudouridine(55) synthase TruB [Ramlibacter sp.]|nr:tRNA pseudouridine(55) synthase TruB [Ramlibacter sp.]